MKAYLLAAFLIAVALSVFVAAPEYTEVIFNDTGFAEVQCNTVQQAGILGSVKEWISLKLLATLATIALGTGGIKLGLSYKKITNTLKETGEFMTTLSDALEDKHLTQEELTAIVKEGKDVFAVWT